MGNNKWFSVIGKNSVTESSRFTLNLQGEKMSDLKIFLPSIRNLSSTSVMRKATTMPQVEVDDASVQQKLGKVNMDFVRKAEKRNKERAERHRFFRKTDWMIAAFCFSLVISIYTYTIWAVKQEAFLDDFEMPEEIDRTKPEDK